MSLLKKTHYICIKKINKKSTRNSKNPKLFSKKKKKKPKTNENKRREKLKHHKINAKIIINVLKSEHWPVGILVQTSESFCSTFPLIFSLHFGEIEFWWA